MAVFPQARKSLGQHFLRDDTYVQRLVRSIDPHPHDTIIEIGAGPGVLTKPLLATGVKVVAVEKDHRFIETLVNLDGDITVVEADALTVDFTALAPKGAKIAGNLPYNVGTQILVQALEQGPYFHSLTFMLQKEVVGRIMAKPGSGDWGRLGVLCDLLCDRSKLFDIPPGAFMPPPKVTSSVVQLTPLPAPRFAVDRKKLDILLRAAFGQRRKMLKSSLKNQINWQAVNDIDPARRPETLTTEEFCRLSSALRTS